MSSDFESLTLSDTITLTFDRFMLQNLPWTRYWYPRGNSLTYSGDGFLPDPNDRWEKTTNPGLKQIHELDQIPCLILLGEAGLGKTDVLERETSRLKALNPNIENRIIYKNLGKFGSDAAIFRNLFDSAAILNWLEGEGDLYLILDAFDEGLIELTTLAGLIEEELKKWPLHRLKLRIACRPAVWQLVLEGFLVKSFNGKDAQVYNLAPLTRNEVLLAAETVGLPDCEKFLRDIVNRSVTPFAIRPVTLKMLLSIYKRDGSLPQTQAEIYRQGCKHLCKELADSRVDKQQTGNLSAEQRLSIAQRIAVVSVYCNKATINLLPEEHSDQQNATLLLEAFHGEANSIFTDDNIRETLGTALFSTSGSAVISWAHRSYCEFLAAEWCRNNNVAPPDLFELITVGVQGQKRIPTQIIQAAAWLAEIFSPVRTLIMRHDPKALLNCDPQVLDNRARKRLAITFLKRYESRDETENYHRQFRVLCHPGLSKQLKPYIKSKTRLEAARQIAVAIAMTCSVKDLDKDLRKLALDPQESRQLRVSALAALSEVASDSSKQALRSFVLHQKPDDIDDEFKGWALRAIWPSHLDPEELFNVLSFPKKLHFHGGYSTFLHSLSDNLAMQLPVDHLPSALRWAMQFHANDIDANTLGWLSDAIVRFAWLNADDDRICKPLSEFILNRINAHSNILLHETLFGEKTGATFRELLYANPTRRHKLLLMLIPCLVGTTGRYFAYRFGAPFADDADWLVEQQSRLSGQERELAKHWLCDLPDVPLKGSAILKGFASRKLDSTFLELIYVDLASPLANALRERARESARWNLPPKPLYPSPDQRVEICLAKAEKGDVKAWIPLTYELTLASDSTSYPNHDTSDVMKFAGWESGNCEKRDRIMKASFGYACRAETCTFEFVGTNICPHWARAEYKALLLMLQKSPEKLQGVHKSIFMRWSIVSLWYPFSKDADLQRKLISVLSTSWPSIFADAVEAILAESKPEQGCYALSSNLAYCSSAEIQRVIENYLKNTSLMSACSHTMLRHMLKQRSEIALNLAINEINRMIEAGEGNDNACIELAVLLIQEASGSTWKLLWPLLNQEKNLGATVLERVAGFGDRVSFTQELNDHELADLYIWLETKFSVDTDAEHDGAHFVGGRDSVSYLRNTVLAQIRQRGATQEVERIMKQFPGQEWLHWHRNATLSIQAERDWVAPTPQAVLGLAKPIALAKPKLTESGLAVLLNIVAGVILFFVPGDMSKIEKLWLLSSIVCLTLYCLFFRLLRLWGGIRFWTSTIFVGLLGSADASYLFERWWMQ